MNSKKNPFEEAIVKMYLSLAASDKNLCDAPDSMKIKTESFSKTMNEIFKEFEKRINV